MPKKIPKEKNFRWGLNEKSGIPELKSHRSCWRKGERVRVREKKNKRDSNWVTKRVRDSKRKKVRERVTDWERLRIRQWEND